MTTDVRRLQDAMERRDTNGIYDILAEANGWPARHPSRCVGCSPHPVHELANCPTPTVFTPSCRCPLGALPARTDA